MMTTMVIVSAVAGCGQALHYLPILPAPTHKGNGSFSSLSWPKWYHNPYKGTLLLILIVDNCHCCRQRHIPTQKDWPLTFLFSFSFSSSTINNRHRCHQQKGLPLTLLQWTIKIIVTEMIFQPNMVGCSFSSLKSKSMQQISSLSSKLYFLSMIMSRGASHFFFSIGGGAIFWWHCYQYYMAQTHLEWLMW